MKYSFLLSVYAKEKPEYLRQSIESMIHQTAAPDEILLIKDGPLTSELDQVIDEYSISNNGLFTILSNKTNLGLGPSLAKGVINSRNELIARMDSDDISRLDRIEKQLKCFEKNSSLSICGGAIREFADDQFEKTAGYRNVPLTDKECKTYLRKRCPFNHMTVMYRKSEVLRSGNYQSYLYNEDYLLWIRMMEAGCTFENLPDVLVDVRISADMYASRRGGEAYYKSEKGIQDILLDDGIINRFTWFSNVAKRWIVEKGMTPEMRSFVFRHFARSRNDEKNK